MVELFKRKTVDERKAILRRKLVNNELNPLADIILTLFLLTLSPFIWIFSQLHDKIMFKFLNNIYIYNVSWEDPRMDHRVMNLTENERSGTYSTL